MFTKRGKGEHLLKFICESAHVCLLHFYTCECIFSQHPPCTPHSSHAFQAGTKFKRCHAMSLEHTVHLVRTSSVANSLQLVQLEMMKALVSTALTMAEGSTESDIRCQHYSYTAFHCSSQHACTLILVSWYRTQGTEPKVGGRCFFAGRHSFAFVRLWYRLDPSSHILQAVEYL